MIPTGRGDEPQSGSPSAAELYPPMRFSLDAKNNSYTRTIMLGGASLPYTATMIGFAGVLGAGGCIRLPVRPGTRRTLRATAH